MDPVTLIVTALAAGAAGSQAGKYAVDVRGAQGVQVGDRNTQTSTFGPAARADRRAWR